MTLKKIYTVLRTVFPHNVAKRLTRFLEKTALDRVLKVLDVHHNSWSSFHLKKNELSTTDIKRARYRFKITPILGQFIEDQYCQ